MTRPPNPILAPLFALALLIAAVPPAAAESIDVKDASKTPVLLQADELTYNEDLGVVTATGQVEMSQGSRVLMADTVTYNQKANTVTASGNVALMEPTGEVLFTDYAELHDELKTGFIENLRGLLSDGSRIAANRARRTADGRKIMDRGVFSPCNLCQKDPTHAPLWQIKAVKIVHDETTKDIIYHDATMELYGVPILYTPYLRHPDPTVDRRSGFLAPTLGVSGDLGFIYGQPYYYAFDASRDLTIEPMIFTAEGTVIRGEYRQRFSNGQIDLKATGAYVDQYENGDETGQQGLEGSADMDGQFALDRTWRGGFNFQQASDRTYLKRFRLGYHDVLTSRLYAEGFRGRNYAAVNAYKWQDLRASTDPDDTPIVLPYAQYNFVGQPDRIGGRSSLDTSLMALTRDSGTDSRRASAVYGWKLPYTTSSGQILTVQSRVQTDAYYASDLSGEEDGTDDTTARFFPQLGAKWQYPWARRTGTTTQVVEPIVGVVAAPSGGNPDEIPNEDSRSFEFDTTNLFSLNRYGGVDRVTTGSRVDYGLRAGVYGDGGGSTEVLVGQSYRFYGDSAFEAGSGLDEQLSDIVGAISVRPRSEIDLSYRFRLDKDSGKIRRNEVGLAYYHPRFWVVSDYVAFDDSIASDLTSDREQLETTFNVNLTPNWSSSVNFVYDLSDGDNKLLRGRIGAAYNDECLSFGVDLEHSDLEDEGISADTRVMFRIVFKYLGGVESR